MNLIERVSKGVPNFSCGTLLVAMVAWGLPAMAASAEPPPFDRPGLSFAPAVLPAGSFDWEQGLPDVEFDDSDGVRSRSYMADGTIRLGLTDTLEMQVSGAPWNRLDLHAGDARSRTEGVGDTKLGFKWAPRLSNQDVSFALLGAVTLPTGSAAFTNGRDIYSLGAVLARDLANERSASAYINVDRSAGRNAWTMAANFGFPIRGSLAGFVEAGRMAGGGQSATLAGGGLTWLLADRIQFDLAGRWGITPHSPDLQAGCGISIFWK